MSQLRITPNRSLPLSPVVWITAVAWIAAIVLALLLGQEYGLFDRPSSNGLSVVMQVLTPQFGALEALALMFLVMWMTRKRPVIDAAAIGIPRSEAAYVLKIVTVYGFLAIMGGYALGTALDTHAFSFHLPGTLIGSHSHYLVTPTQTIAWSLYNLFAYVVIPFAYLRSRFASGRSFLRSNNLRGDIVLIVTILAIEVVVQILAISTALFDLTAGEFLLGAPLSFFIYLLGTGLPTMIFVQMIIVPRLMVVTGSFVGSVVLGGVAYTLVHMPESWMTFTSPSQVVLSLIFLFFTYFFPGMVKAVITLRTGNAWVHMWSYHAIAPHVIIDTPLIVAIFAL